MDEFEQYFPAQGDKAAAVQPQQAVANTSQDPSFDTYFPATKQNQNNASQNTFMDMLDAFNSRVNNFSTGTQSILNNLPGFKQILPTDEALAQENKVMNQWGDQAISKSPIAGRIAAGLGDLTNMVYTSAATGGMGILNPAKAPYQGALKTSIDKAAETAALSGAEGLLEAGTPEERIKRGGVQAGIGLLGQGTLEGIGLAGKAGINMLNNMGTKEALKTAGIGAAGYTLADLGNLDWKDVAGLGAAVIGAKVLKGIGNKGASKERFLKSTMKTLIPTSSATISNTTE